MLLRLERPDGRFGDRSRPLKSLLLLPRQALLIALDEFELHSRQLVVLCGELSMRVAEL